MRDMTPLLIKVAVISGICILFLAGFLAYMSTNAPNEPEPIKPQILF